MRVLFNHMLKNGEIHLFACEVANVICLRENSKDKKRNVCMEITGYQDILICFPVESLEEGNFYIRQIFNNGFLDLSEKKDVYIDKFDDLNKYKNIFV